MTKKFTPGQLVTLKSGGPVMTVRRYDNNDEIICDWFVGNTPTFSAFQEEQLQLEPPAK